MFTEVAVVISPGQDLLLTGFLISNKDSSKLSADPWKSEPYSLISCSLLYINEPMQALTIHGKASIKYTSIPDPKVIFPTDAIIKVHHSAICGSDLHIYRALEKGIDPGTAMGHEFIGEIIDLGDEVQRFKLGELVVSPFTTSCGNCYYCNIGLTCRCDSGQLFGWVENGHGLEGAQAEYVRVPLADGSLVKVPENIHPEVALFTGDIMATGYYCADQLSIKAEGMYVVIGCGPVGLMAIMAARELGAKQLYAIDRLPERLQMAKAFGATPLHLEHDSPKEVIMDMSSGRGADGIMEAVGHPSASRLAYELIRAGGTISTVGVHTTEQFSFSPVDAYNKNLTYKIGRAPARHYMEYLLGKIPELAYDFTQLITHRFPLQEGAYAYELFDQKLDNCMKVLLQP